MFKIHDPLLTFCKLNVILGFFVVHLQLKIELIKKGILLNMDMLKKKIKYFVHK